MVRVLFPHSRDYQETDFFFFLSLVVLYVFLEGGRVKNKWINQECWERGLGGKEKNAIQK